MTSQTSGFGRAVSSFDPDESKTRKVRRKSKTASRSPEAHKAPNKSSFSRLIDLCAVRDRSEKELRERLGKDGYSNVEIEEAIARGKECNFINDMRFADSFIRGKVSAGKGQRLIECELEKHNIDAASIEGWPYEYGLCEEDQVKRAIDFLNAHPPKAKDVWGSAYRKLIAKGYPSNVASPAVRTWFNQQER